MSSAIQILLVRKALEYILNQKNRWKFDFMFHLRPARARAAKKSFEVTHNLGYFCKIEGKGSLEKVLFSSFFI